MEELFDPTLKSFILIAVNIYGIWLLWIKLFEEMSRQEIIKFID